MSMRLFGHGANDFLILKKSVEYEHLSVEHEQMSMRVLGHRTNDHTNVGLWISCYTKAQMIECTDDSRCVNRVYMSVRMIVGVLTESICLYG